MRYYSQSSRSVPSAWETWAAQARSQAALGYLKVDGLRIKYVGPGEDDRQAATIIANHPVPLDCPLFYFEITVVSRGAEGFIGIGLQQDDVSLGRLPGWEAHSYGYHGDDGHSFCGNGRGSPYGPTFTSGDVIGCLLNRTNRTISYYKNGMGLGVAFRDFPEDRLHPCVGLRTPGEEVVANFGGQPFVTDFDSVMASYKWQVTSSIASTSLPLLSSQGTPLIPQLLYDHLMHHRCPETAAIIARDMLSGSQDGAAMSEASTSAASGTAPTAPPHLPGGGGGGRETAGLQLIHDLVVAGRVEEAVAETTRRYTRAPIDADPGLDFRLKVAQFCELLRVGGPGCAEAALAYGRSNLSSQQPRGSHADEELLSDALSLLAYERPETSPCGHLMGQATRDRLAEALNRAVLRHLGLPAVGPLERAFQQASVVLEQLRSYNVLQATVIDLKAMVNWEGSQSPAPSRPIQGVIMDLVSKINEFVTWTKTARPIPMSRLIKLCAFKGIVEGRLMDLLQAPSLDQTALNIARHDLQETGGVCEGGGLAGELCAMLDSLCEMLPTTGN